MVSFLITAVSRKRSQSSVSETRCYARFGYSVADLLVKLPEDLRPRRELIDAAKELDKAYIPTRYPNAHPEGAPFEIYSAR